MYVSLQVITKHGELEQLLTRLKGFLLNANLHKLTEGATKNKPAQRNKASTTVQLLATSSPSGTCSLLPFLSDKDGWMESGKVQF